MASLLTILLSGFGCLHCCTVDSTQSATVTESRQSPVIETETAEQHPIEISSHACCKKHTEPVNAKKAVTASKAAHHEAIGRRIAQVIPVPGTMVCCQILSNPASTPQASYSGDSQALPQNINKILSAPAAKQRTAPVAFQLPLRDRGHTYLTCCVFLI